MKAGIMTHYDVHNHGAHLQLYALVKVLKELGYDAKALRYLKNYDFMGGAEASKKYSPSFRSIPVYLSYLRKNGICRTLYNIKKRRVLAAFRQKEQLVGEFYSEARDLDAVVIGSDEIFSIEAGPNPWFYGIGIPCKNQISYGASFGPTTLQMLEEHGMSAMVSAGINQLRNVSVRDENSAEIVETYTGKRPMIVCDPVLLYDFSVLFSEEIMRGFRQKVSEKYCIVYSYDDRMNDKKTIQMIREYAKRHELKIYSIAFHHKWCDKSIQVFPLDIFVWFRGAEVVFTDTFHGSVLSLVTGREFISKVSGNGNKLAFLLRQYGVEHRLAEDFDRIDTMLDKPLDHDAIKENVLRIRMESMEYLAKSLETPG